MKAIRLVWALLLFVVCGGCNHQTASQTAANERSTNSASPFGANDEVLSTAIASNAPAGFIPDPPPGFVPLPPGLVLDPFPASNRNAVANRIEETRAKAEKGDVKAQCVLGLIYHAGVGVIVDNREAAKWYRKAAAQGSTNALADLADIYGDEKSTLYNAGESFQFAQRAAKAGVATAKVSLGFKYLEGRGVAANKDEGLRWLREGISALEATAAKATSNTNDPLLARGWRMLIAENASRLGSYYFEGRFLPKDVTNAVCWYEKAAEQGDEPYFRAFQSHLGFMHATETKNYAEAVRWFLKAAEGGDAIAQYDLGLQYANGQGVPRDDAEAVKWYRKSAEQGLAIAQFSVGSCYEYGHGVEKDSAEAEG